MTTNKIRRRPKGAVPRLLAASVLLLLALAAGPAALAQTEGAIAGTLMNGTEDAPLADAEVSVQLFSVEADLGTLTTTTDARGRFTFDELPDGVAGYQLSAEYEGAVYRGIATGFTAGSTTADTLTVWEPTTDPEAVTLADYIVWVDREGEGVAVQHDFAWDNGTDAAYVGDEDGVVTVPLPQGATGLQFLGTFLENPGEVIGDAYVSDAPIAPGQTTATIRYNAPPLSQMTLELPFATTSVQLFVPQDVQVTATALRMAGTITDNGLTYQVYAAEDLAAGTTIDVQMSEAEGGGSGSSSATTILLIALAILIVGGIVVWLVGRRRSARAGRSAMARSAARPMRAKARPAERSANGRAAQPAARAEGNGKAPEAFVEDPDLIVEEIAALDLSFERGLLDERTYKRLRVAAKDRLLRAEGARSKGGRAR
jgi:hypothetical protein